MVMSLELTDDGIHMIGTILWFDSCRAGQLSFLSSAMNIRDYSSSQFIATEETLKILEIYKKRPKALVCQYNRPFSVGRLKMELLPSGVMLGGASLLIEHEGKRILYLPVIQTKKLSTVRKAQITHADILILGADRPFSGNHAPNRKKEIERLLFATKKYIAHGSYPIIFCKPTGTAQELTKLLCESNIPVAVQSNINRINKIYETFESNLGNYTKYSKKPPKDKVVLISSEDAQHRFRSRINFQNAPILYVEDNLGDRFLGDFGLNISERFYIDSVSTGRDIVELISKISPKELYVFGVYTKQYLEELKSTQWTLQPLFLNSQPTLF